MNIVATTSARRALAATLFCLVTATAPGCADLEEPAPPPVETSYDQVSQPIVNGSPASAYAEAALINMPGTICSGSVIAPRVVLTAGHCVVGVSSFTVVTPYAGGQSAKGTRSWTDYVENGPYVNPSTLDVAVILLDKPINLASYPSLASAAQAAGTSAVNVGRIRNGQASYSGLFVGSAVTLKAGSSYGFPRSYVTAEIIESGDSGGPVYVGSGASRQIVAVNSGGGGGTQVLARVDLAYAKIQQLIAANGGSGGTATPPPAPAPTPAPSPSPAPSCTGTPEAEPNDTSTAANPLAGTRCGALASSSDIDWYTWSVDKAGVAYDVSLTTKGDAEILMWKWTGSAWSAISNTSATKIAATSGGAGTYVLAVRGASAQSYGVKLTR